ncbi:LAME_0H05358g1_1 [Lachancea meyersii CBS 8951]|uniref:LAME_0H05358g1_1 n=1 Tax=Lachancea meyersii CBS 8951 TaxID=1266667 RepID=A0A1G4KEC4_9SACH|nr:LAME_0H05358g1_1 [Lachancea meyersii CBS 8951]
MTVPKSTVPAVPGLAAVQTKNPSSWDAQDDVLLRHLKEVKKLGWKEIAQYFKNRTPNACQFRWRRLRSGNLKTAGKPTESSEDHTGGAGADPQHQSLPLTMSASASPAPTNLASAAVAVADAKPITLSNSSTGSQYAPTPTPALPTASVAAPVGASGFGSSSAATYKPGSNPTSTAASSRSMTPVIAGGIAKNSYMDAPIIPSGPASAPGIPMQSALGYLPYQHLAHQPSLNRRSQSHSSIGPDKFVKPRSYSHTMAPPSSLLHPSSASHLPSIEVNKTLEDENLGLIPKVLVRSRRSSVAQHAPLPHMNLSTPALASTSSSNLTAALNTTLTTSKLPKNSFSSRPRRSSFHMAAPDRIYSTPSRRGSVVQAPTSVASLTRRESFNNHTSRRDSYIHPRRESFVQISLDRRESISNYTDVPRSNLASFTPAMGTGLSHAHSAAEPLTWSLDEDRLLHERQEKHLSLDELSILLPHRSEEEIQWRLGTLGVTSSSPASNSPLDSPDRSLTDDTAIEEESNAVTDENPRHPSQVVFDIKKEVSPSLSLSPSSNGRENSPVFSPHPINREASPATFDASSKAGMGQSLEDPKYNCSPSLSEHRSVPYTAVNSAGSSVAHRAALPPLNSLLKDIL